MSLSEKNLSSFDPSAMPDASGMRIGIAVSQWNGDITEKLYEAACQTLVAGGCRKEHIIRRNVPGSFELPAAAKFFIDEKTVDAVICLGCVIRGETSHYDYICQAVSQGIMWLTIQHSMPVIFGVLTTENKEQAMDRAGGRHGNKGVEAAVSAIRMVSIKKGKA